MWTTQDPVEMRSKALLRDSEREVREKLHKNAWRGGDWERGRGERDSLREGAEPKTGPK